MSLNPFGSKRKTFVETKIIRVIEDNFIPDVGKNGIIEALFKEQDISSTIIEHLINDAVSKYHRAYNYAKKGLYYYGLPDAQVITDKPDANVIKATLDTVAGFPVTLIYVEYAPLNHTHKAWETLFNTLGFNKGTNEITGLSTTVGFSCYLDKIVPVYQTSANTLPDSGTWNQWERDSSAGWTPERTQGGALTTYIGHDYIAGENETDGAQIHYTYVDGGGAIQKAIHFVDLSGFPDNRSFFHAKYQYTDGVGVEQTRYWTYLDGAGTYPDVDALFDLRYTQPGSYFPFVMFRRNDQNRTREEVRESEEFLSTQKYLKILGMDFVQIGTAIHDNPDIGDIDQAVMMMGIPIDSDHPLDLAYLYAFFLRLHGQTPYDEVEDNIYGIEPDRQRRPTDYTTDRTLDVVTAPSAPYAINFQDADFNMTMSFGGIIRSVKAGVKGEVGTYTTKTTTTLYRSSVYDANNTTETNYRLMLSEGINVVLTKQISENVYEELIIIDPTMRYNVHDQYGVIKHAKAGDFIIPLDRELCNNFSHLQKSVLYPRSLHFVFNARVVQKLEWYETGFFKFVLVVVTIAIAVFTGGAGSFLTGLATAIGAGAVALGIFLLKTLVYSFVFRYVFKIVVQELGIEAALVLAVIAAATGIANQMGLVPGIDDTLANVLLVASSGLVQGANLTLQENYEDLLEDISEFNLYQDEALKELKQAEDLLKEDVSLSPFILFGESPTEFYNRTVHIDNVGMLGIESIKTFVDRSLTLPDITDTLGGIHV